MSKNKRRTKVVDLDKKQLLSSIAFFRAMNVSQKKEKKNGKKVWKKLYKF